MEKKTHIYYDAERNTLIIDTESLINYIELEKAFGNEPTMEDFKKYDHRYEINLDGVNNVKIQ